MRAPIRASYASVSFATILFCWGVGQAIGDDTLAERLQPLIAAHHGKVSVSAKHLGTGEEFHFEADRPMPTASLIKFPLMVSAYGKIVRNELKLDQRIVLRDEDKVPGSGILTDHFSAGTDLSLRDAIHLMIVWSDNTATNLVVDQVGLQQLKQDMQALGMTETRMNSKVYRRDLSIDPERSKLYGLGSTTSRDIVRLLELMERGELHSPEACLQMKEHMLVCDDKTKIVRLLPKSVKVAHKSGEVSASRNEAGIIYSGSGPIALCVLTTDNQDTRYEDDNEAHVLISRIALETYRYFNPRGEPLVAGGPLENGAEGELVADLQRTLNARISPSPELSVDGEFGNATETAVKAFQKSQGLAETGAVDEEFWERLGPLVTVESSNGSESPRREIPELAPEDGDSGPPWVTAQAWAVFDGQTGQQLAGHECRTPRQIASTTKIMTAWMILRLAQIKPEILNERVTFSPAAAETEGSSTGLKPGESVTVDQLMYGLLLPSGNDAAVALAEHFGGRVGTTATNNATCPLAENGRPASSAADPLRQFVEAMNAESQRLGMTGTHWTNTNGLPDADNVSTASDLGSLAVQAMQMESFRRVVGTRQFACDVAGPGGYRRQAIWYNTNKLLDIAGYGGIKTGTTDAAGSCLVGEASRDDRHRIAVVLGATSTESRYTDIRNLFRWSWSLPVSGSTDREPPVSSSDQR